MERIARHTRDQRSRADKEAGSDGTLEYSVPTLVPALGGVVRREEVVQAVHRSRGGGGGRVVLDVDVGRSGEGLLEA